MQPYPGLLGLQLAERGMSCSSILLRVFHQDCSCHPSAPPPPPHIPSRTLTAADAMNTRVRPDPLLLGRLNGLLGLATAGAG